MKYDVVVIGSGIGGYVAAIRASQLGLKCAVVEKEKSLGGTCLNVGCIPSKALLESSELFAQASHKFAEHGITVSEPKIDVGVFIARKEKVVQASTRGVQFLMKKNKIDVIAGFGTIAGPGVVKVGEQTLETVRIVIATGSVVSPLPGVVTDGEVVVTSNEAISFSEVPKQLAVIGGGVIGLELGSVWSRLGSRVTVLEYMPTIFPGADAEICQAAEKIFTKQGIEFVLGARVKSAKKAKRGAEVVFEYQGKEQTLTVDKVLLAVGRKPFTEGLGLETIGVKVDERGRVPVDAHFQTSAANVYAIGDVIAGPMLAHKAEEEGVAVAEIMAGKPGHVDYDAIPNVIYTHPEIASVGKTEEQLQKEGIAYNKGSFPFSANGRARALGESDGFVKILADKTTDRIIGAHIIGPRAGDLIAELAVAVEFKASAEDIARSVHAHPTLAEAIKEAALGVAGRMINF